MKAIPLALVLFVAATPASFAAKAKACPAPDSAAETSLLFQEGPDFVDGAAAGPCLQALIQRKRADLGNPKDLSDQDLVQMTMDSITKADSEDAR